MKSLIQCDQKTYQIVLLQRDPEGEDCEMHGEVEGIALAQRRDKNGEVYAMAVYQAGEGTYFITQDPENRIQSEKCHGLVFSQASNHEGEKQ